MYADCLPNVITQPALAAWDQQACSIEHTHQQEETFSQATTLIMGAGNKDADATDVGPIMDVDPELQEIMQIMKDTDEGIEEMLATINEPELVVVD